MEFIKVREKPVEVEAFKLTEEMIKTKVQADLDYDISQYSRATVNEYVNGLLIAFLYKKPNKFYVKVETLEGFMKAYPGDWIIKGINGEIYPCKDDIFNKTYDVI